MSKSKSFIICCIVFFSQVFFFHLIHACNTRIIQVKCEYQYKPINIDDLHPRFSWQIQSNEQDLFQTSYVLLIATSPELLNRNIADIWQSGRINTSMNMAVYSGPALKSHTKYYYRVAISTNKYKNDIYSSIETFETVKLSEGDWTAKWITDSYEKDFEPSPLFRKTFDVKKQLVKARLYISGLGYYELFLNGSRVGKNYLDPAYTHFNKRVLYSTYDVLSLINVGKNAIASVLGNGWFNEQSIAVWNFHNAVWRKRPQIICELMLSYADGSIQIIGTDDTWKTNLGAYIYNNIYSGDMIDARKEEKGWKLPSFVDTHWNKVKIVDSPAPILSSQQMPGIQIDREIKPKSVKVFSDSLYLFDMGENFSGLCRLKVSGSRGTVISLRHGEMLKSNGRLEQGNINVYYKPKQKKEIFQTDIYTLSGDGEEVFTPGFSYHGFRYVEIQSSKPIKLTKQNLTGLFLHTNLESVGRFSCSNELLNKLWAATMQSYKSNVHSIPTDCPQREKNGWTADAHIAIDLAFLNFNAIKFYEKWMQDFIDNQRPDGSVSGIIPSAGWGYGEWPGPVWDAAMFIIPDAIYNYYGDIRTIKMIYPTLEKYLTYLKNKEKEGKITFGIGDWVFYKTKTPTDFTTMCYYYQDYAYMTRFADLLGIPSQLYREKAEKLKLIINTEYFHPETGFYTNGSQAAQALALYLNLVPRDKEKIVADNLVKKIRENNYFLDFGLIGSKTVLRMLTKYGYVEDAFKMIIKDKAPSWGYWIATKKYNTLPETWIMSSTFNDASLNHVFLGDVSAWLVNDIAGINYNYLQVGFKDVVIKPHFVSGLKWVKAEYRSRYGFVKSEWIRSGKKIVLIVNIPANCTATVYVDKITKISSGRYVFNLLNQ